MKKIENYSRINGAVDVELLQRTHIIGVGAGGAYCLYESLARSAVGKLTVLDFDTVDDVNLTRQGYEMHQLGKRKVDALGEHLQNVNAGMEYTGITKNFLDMNNEELDSIFGKGDLFLFLTDSFAAQAFGNKLALRYGKPAIWAGFYEKSQAAEIVFTIPGVTPACFRCAVSPRYEAQKSSENEIRISSGCNTIFHSQVLDAYVGMLLMAVLHNDLTGYEFSNWFGKQWERNLIQLKIHPDYGTENGSLFHRTFSGTEGRVVTFNSVFQKIEAECPPKYLPCQDCGGSGDLRYCIHES
jgi:molybdopterin/thiamine biosynthesis adenylyltransferase